MRCRLTSTRGLRSEIANTRSTKSGPGRCRCCFGTPLQVCESRLCASSPSRSSICASVPAVVTLISSYLPPTKAQAEVPQSSAFQRAATPQLTDAECGPRTSQGTRCLAVDVPQQLAVLRSDELRRQGRILAGGFENAAQDIRLLGASHYKHYTCSIIEDRASEAHPVGSQLLHPRRHDQPPRLCQCLAAGKERGGVPISSETQKNQIEAG